MGPRMVGWMDEEMNGPSKDSSVCDCRGGVFLGKNPSFFDRIVPEGRGEAISLVNKPASACCFVMSKFLVPK